MKQTYARLVYLVCPCPAKNDSFITINMVSLIALNLRKANVWVPFCTSDGVWKNLATLGIDGNFIGWLLYCNISKYEVAISAHCLHGYNMDLLFVSW